MAFNISDFRANITGAASKSVAKQSHFELVFTLPSKILLSDRSRVAYESLRFRIEAAELPGRQIQSTNNYKPSGYGLTSKIGYDVIYPDVSLTMICSSDLGEKSFFQAWQSVVVGNHTRNSDIRAHQSIGYYSDYTAPVAIIQYDETGKVTYSMTLAEAYPVVINSMPLNWGSEDFHRLSVQFAYKHFIETDEPQAGRGAAVNQSGVSLTLNPGLGTIDDKLADFGLPRIGEILNIPLFNTESITVAGGSRFNTIFT
jgi:hypothetical protein